MQWSKELLVTGTVVKVKCGKYGMVINNWIYFRDGTLIKVKDYNDDLVAIRNQSLNIEMITHVNPNEIKNFIHVDERFLRLHKTHTHYREHKEDTITLSDGTKVSENTIKMLLKKEYGG